MKINLIYADKIRAAAHKQVDKYGVIREVCAAPTFDYQGIAPEAQAFFPSDGSGLYGLKKKNRIDSVFIILTRD